MARNINFLFAILVVIGIAALALGARSCSAPKYPAFVDPKMSLEDAMARSGESGKPVFALVAADWCEHCAALKAGALADRGVVGWVKDNTEPVYVDATRLNPTDPNRSDPEVRALMDRLKVNSLPALILLKKGSQLGHVEGEKSAAEVLAWLQSTAR